MMEFNVMRDARVSCHADKLTGLVSEAIDSDVPAADILKEGLIAGGLFNISYLLPERKL